MYIEFVEFANFIGLLKISCQTLPNITRYKILVQINKLISPESIFFLESCNLQKLHIKIYSKLQSSDTTVSLGENNNLESLLAANKKKNGNNDNLNIICIPIKKLYIQNKINKQI